MKRLLGILVLLVAGFALARPPIPMLSNTDKRMQPPVIYDYTYTATAFNAADRIIHAGDYTGASDSKLWTFSTWFKLSNAAEDGTARTLYRSGGGLFLVVVEDGTATGDSVANGIYVQAQDSGFNNVMRFVITSPTFVASATWQHLAFSVDTANAANRHVYVNGAPATVVWVTYTIDSVMYFNNGGDAVYMAYQDGSNPMTGSLCEPINAPGIYLDLSASITLLRTAGGKPANVGATGSTPFGATPKVFLHKPFGTFEVNDGDGGAFTVTGTLADDASIP